MIPQVFRSIREMDAYDEGDDMAHVCALCGELLTDCPRRIIGRDENEDIIAMEVCNDCYYKNEIVEC